MISVNTCSELTAGVLFDVMLPDQYSLTMHAEERLTAFLELESAIHEFAVDAMS